VPVNQDVKVQQQMSIKEPQVIETKSTYLAKEGKRVLINPDERQRVSTYDIQLSFT